MRKFNMINEGLIGSDAFYAVVEEIKRMDYEFTEKMLSDVCDIPMTTAKAVIELFTHSGVVNDLGKGWFKRVGV